VHSFWIVQMGVKIDANPGEILVFIARELTRAHLVMSSPAPTGGYALARPADEISVLEIVEALEGPLTPSECVLHGGPCHWEDVCPMHLVWSGALQALTSRLASGSLATVAAADRALAKRQFDIPDDAHRRRARVEQ
jgi:Rrf2 family protein